MLSNILTFSNEKNYNKLIKKVIEYKSYLNLEEAEELFEYFLCNAESSNQLSSILAIMHYRGESMDEIMGLYNVIQRHLKKIDLNIDNAIDIGGTGGGKPTFNISTASALIVAAAGIRVCKHGNYKVSSKSGSFDFLTSLGLNVSLCNSFEFSKMLYNRFGITFLSTRVYHNQPPHLINVRREIGFSTIFNLIGPLLNPAKVPYQVVGIANPNYMQAAAKILLSEGRKGFTLVHGQEGIDEVSPSGLTNVLEFKNEKFRSYILSPNDFGLNPISPSFMKSGTPDENAYLFTELLNGNFSEHLQIILPTIALSLYTCNTVKNIKDGVVFAKEIIQKGKAKKLLSDLKDVMI